MTVEWALGAFIAGRKRRKSGDMRNDWDDEGVFQPAVLLHRGFAWSG